MSHPRRRLPLRRAARRLGFWSVLAVTIAGRSAGATPPPPRSDGAWPRPGEVAALAATEAPSSGPAAPAPEEAGASRPDDTLARLASRVARPGGLTAASAASRAVASSPEARARDAERERAEAELDRAELGRYPRLALQGRYARLSPVDMPLIGPPGVGFRFPQVLDQAALEARVTIPLSDHLARQPATEASQREAAQSARHGAEAARRAVDLRARLAYYAWARAELQRVVADQAVVGAKQHLAVARAGRSLGRTPEVEVLRAESLLAAAELLRERTASAAALGEARLRTLVHARAGERFEIGEDLLASPDERELPGVSELVARALPRRPELDALERTRRSLVAQRRATVASAAPRVDAFAGGLVAHPNPRIVPQSAEFQPTWDVGVQVSWSPNDLAAGADSASAVDARLRGLDAERAALVDAVTDEVTAARLGLGEAHAASRTAARGLLAAEEAYRVRRELRDLGRGTLVELIDSESDVLRARLELVHARVDARVARARLDHAVGGSPGVP